MRTLVTKTRTQETLRVDRREDQDNPRLPHRKGIQFRDITTLIKDSVGFRLVVDSLARHHVSIDLEFDFDIIVGVESRGFILGGALEYGISFILYP